MSELTEREWSLFSLSRAISAAAHGGLTKPCIEREILREHAEIHGLPFEPTRFTVPWTILQRDLSAATTYPLVATETAAARDVLRETSLVAKLGAEVMGNLQGSLTIPVATSAVAGEWLSDELDPMTAAQPAVGQISLSPKRAGALVKFSHQLLQQAPSTDTLLAQHVTRSVGRLLDVAVLAGTGNSGQPLGLLNTPSIGSLTIDATDAIGDALSAVQLVREAGTEPTAWVTTPAVVTLLSKRERAAGNGMVIEDGKLCGIPVIATTACPTGKAFVGDWTKLLIAVWGRGVEIAVDPYTAFTTGMISMRALLTCDVGAIHRGAFAAGAVS
jgi:HK97 family phage major capsid protein